MSKPSRMGTPLEISVPSVRVKRATAIFLSKMPRTGNLRSVRSIAIRPTGVPYHTFSPTIAPPSVTNINNPNMLPIKLLIPMTMRVGSGRVTPRPANNVAKMGTTFHNNKTITLPATPSTATGYTMADLTARFSLTFFSM